MTCSECTDLRRNLISIVSEHRHLMERVRSRHASPPERRRLHRLKTDRYIAQQLLQNHNSVCEETT